MTGRTVRFIALALILVLTANMIPFGIADAADKRKALTDRDFLKTSGRDLRNNYGKGEIVNLRGTNVGGWLLQEFWMTPTQATNNVKDEMGIYNMLTQRFGKETMLELVGVYQDNYFTEADFDICADMGINCLRLPFWYRNLVDENGEFHGYDPNAKDPYAEAFARIDWFIEEAGKRGIYVILDMHGTPGSQNGSDHSGVDGGNSKESASQLFFGPNAPANQELFYNLWDIIAERYKGNPVVAGYGLMNEPYCTYRYNSSRSATELHNLLWGIYDTAYKRIREIDPDHVIIMAATWDPVDLPHPSVYGWTNVMYEYHNYLYDDYDNAAGKQITNMESKLNTITNAGYNVPSLMGEFSYFNNYSAWDKGLELLTNSGINWTTWTYKVISSYGNWGLYHHTGTATINLESMTANRIRELWSTVGNIQSNYALINVVKKYLAADTKANTLAPSKAEYKNGEYYLIGSNTNGVINAGDGDLINASAKLYNESDNQIFTLVNNTDDTVSLRSKSTGKYISVDISTKQLYANADSIGDAEKFFMFQVNPMQISFMSYLTGMYLCVDENTAGYPVTANRSSVSNWERFFIRSLNNEEENAGATLKLYNGWNRYEAEGAKIYGGNVEQKDYYSNGKGVGGISTGTALAGVEADWINVKYISFTINIAQAGKYKLSVNYNGDPDKDKTMLLKVNDGEQRLIEIARRSGSKETDLFEECVTVSLTSGINYILVSGGIIDENAWINIDCIDLCQYPVSLVEGADRYEGEHYSLSGKNEIKDYYSVGKSASLLNSDEDIISDVDWNNVKYADFTIYAEEDGNYKVTLVYNGIGGMKAMYKLNDGETKNIALKYSSSEQEKIYEAVFMVSLQKGFNSLKLTGGAGDGQNGFNVDYIDVIADAADGINIVLIAGIAAAGIIIILLTVVLIIRRRKVKIAKTQSSENA